MAETDEIDDALTGQMRVVLTSAAQAAERLYRSRQWRESEGTRSAQQERDRISERYEAERRAAHTQLRATEREGWWDQAQPDAVAAAYQTARAWHLENDPYATEVHERIGREVKERYGLDIDDMEPRDVHGAVREAEAEKEQGERAAADREREEAGELQEQSGRTATPEQGEVVAHEAGLQYDSAERREAEAAAMTSAGVPAAAVEASRLESTSNAEPAANAVKQSAKKRSRTATQQRGGRDRGLER